MMKLETLLREEITTELQELNKLELGTDEYEKTVNGITKLVDRVIKMDENDLEYQDRAEAREKDADIREKQINDERKDRLAKNLIAAVGIVVSVGVTIWGTLKSFEFEKEGTVTTIMGRGFISKLLPKK